jgi:hypothetical protein
MDERKPPEAAPEAPGSAPAPIGAAYRVTPAEIERAVVPTGEQYAADLSAMFDHLAELYAGQLAAKDETIATQREALAALRRRAEAAEAERDALRARGDAPPARVSGAAAGESPAAGRLALARLRAWLSQHRQG